MRILVCALLFPILFACNSRRVVQTEIPINKAELDSLYIAIMIDSLQQEYFDEMNEGVPEEEQTNFGGWYSGSVKYSADSLLLIYSFIGEGCGAYCSPIYTSHIMYDSLELEEWFLPVDSILKLDENNYLILCKGATRLRGVEFEETEQVHQVTINQQIESKNIANVGLSSFIQNTAGSKQFIDTEKPVTLLDYYTDDQTLYAVDYSYDEGSYSDSLACFRTINKYVYTKGRFVQQFVDNTSETRKITD